MNIEDSEVLNVHVHVLDMLEGILVGDVIDPRRYADHILIDAALKLFKLRAFVFKVAPPLESHYLPGEGRQGERHGQSVDELHHGCAHSVSTGPTSACRAHAPKVRNVNSAVARSSRLVMRLRGAPTTKPTSGSGTRPIPLDPPKRSS